MKTNVIRLSGRAADVFAELAEMTRMIGSLTMAQIIKLQEGCYGTN